MEILTLVKMDVISYLFSTFTGVICKCVCVVKAKGNIFFSLEVILMSFTLKRNCTYTNKRAFLSLKFKNILVILFTKKYDNLITSKQLVYRSGTKERIRKYDISNTR